MSKSIAFVDGYHKGAMNLAHIDHHSFRDKSHKPSVYIRNFETSKERANKKFLENQKSFLEKTDFNETEPNKINFMRPKIHI